MTASNSQLNLALSTQRDEPSGLSNRLCHRLQSLGLTLTTVSRDGTVAISGPSRQLERVLVQASPFSQALQRAWPRLSHPSGDAVTVWPGIWLVPVHDRRHTRTPRSSHGASLATVVLITEEFLSSEWFTLICDSEQLDRQATADQSRKEGLLSSSELERMLTVLRWLQDDDTEIVRRQRELQSMSQQLGNSYEELSLLYKLSSYVTVGQAPQQFLSDACNELQQVLGMKWMALQLVDDEPCLNGMAGRVFTAGDTGSDVSLIKRFGSILMVQHRGDRHPVVIEDTQTLGIPHLPRLAKTLLMVCLERDGKPFGVLFGADKLDGSPISSLDSKLCYTLGNSLSIFLENMMLYEDMQTMFIGTLHALTSSIDAKDSYTHGHSERVALLAKMLAQAAGLEEDRVERVYISGLVHDVGKIGVPESVLTKPNPLTDEEFDLVKRHPEIGAHILGDIRQMRDLIPGVLHHHERWDGRGYPYGLAGEEIPLYGRLICLADSFDAMSSNRSYRISMPLDQVLAEIHRCMGTQFDPHLAQLFVDLDFSPFYDLIEKHMHASDHGRV